MAAKKRLTKSGKPDKRFKGSSKPPTMEKMHKVLKEQGLGSVKQDPNKLLEQLLRDNNLILDFDVISGTIPTKHGIIKLDKPTLVVKAIYG